MITARVHLAARMPLETSNYEITAESPGFKKEFA